MSDAGLSTANTPAQNRDALSSAITQARAVPGTASGRSEIHIAPGVYPINSITISTPGTTLRFAPGAVLCVAPGSKYHPSLINIAADNVTIEGGEFDGNGIAGAYGIMAIRITGGASNVAIRNCVVRNTAVGIGAYNVVNAHDWLIEGCTIDSTVSGHGIFLHGNPGQNDSTSGVRLLGNVIRGAHDNGIWIGNRFNDVTVTGNLVTNAGRMGIEVWRNPTGRFVIAGNIVKDCGSFGISIADTSNTVCADNIVDHATGYGIEVANCHHVTLANNHIDTVSTKESGAKPTGISLNSSRSDALGDVSIQGGTITGCVSAINVCGDKGLRRNISVSGVVISGCQYGIRNVGLVGEQDGGGMVEDLVISGCTINVTDVGIGNSVYGGLIRGGVIANNNIHVVKGPGIDLFRPAEMLIANNRIRGEDTAGSIGVRVWDHTSGTLRAHDVAVRDNHVMRFESEHFYSGVAGQVEGDTAL